MNDPRTKSLSRTNPIIVASAVLAIAWTSGMVESARLSIERAFEDVTMTESAQSKAVASSADTSESGGGKVGHGSGGIVQPRAE